MFGVANVDSCTGFAGSLVSKIRMYPQPLNTAAARAVTGAVPLARSRPVLRWTNTAPIRYVPSNPGTTIPAVTPMRTRPSPPAAWL